MFDETVLLHAVDLDLQRARPIATGSASVPPLRIRSSSIDRDAARAERPTSSGRFFSPSSSSMTVSGTTRSTSAKDPMQPGSAISTEVSRTVRRRSPTTGLIASAPESAGSKFSPMTTSRREL